MSLGSGSLPFQETVDRPRKNSVSSGSSREWLPREPYLYERLATLEKSCSLPLHLFQVILCGTNRRGGLPSLPRLVGYFQRFCPQKEGKRPETSLVRHTWKKSRVGSVDATSVSQLQKMVGDVTDLTPCSSRLVQEVSCYAWLTCKPSIQTRN
jgi:hypothetical protein